MLITLLTSHIKDVFNQAVENDTVAISANSDGMHTITITNADIVKRDPDPYKIEIQALIVNGKVEIRSYLAFDANGKSHLIGFQNDIDFHNFVKSMVKYNLDEV